MRTGMVCFAVVLSAAGSALATQGNPHVITGAWVDPETREVLVRVEGPEFPTIRALPLGGERPRRFETVGVIADWSDLGFEERVSRMRDLEPIDSSLVSIESSARSLGRLSEETPRAFGVRVRIRGRSGSRDVRVRAFRTPDVRVVRVLDVPGEPYAIVLLEYVGLAFEGGYTVEEPVLLRWAD